MSLIDGIAGAGGLAAVSAAIAGAVKLGSKLVDRARAKSKADADLAKTKAITYRDVATEKTRADRDVIVRSLDLLESEREDTAKHFTERVDCERRCAKLEAENSQLRLRVDQLESEVRWMRDAIAALMDGRDPRVVAKVMPIGRAKERA